MVEAGEAGCVRALLVVVLGDRERAFFLLHQCPGLRAGFFLVNHPRELGGLQLLVRNVASNPVRVCGKRAT